MAVRERTLGSGEVRAFALEAGEGEDLLVLVHGAEADSGMWGPYIEGLARDRRVMAIDLPGHGRSPLDPEVDCSPPGVGRWFADLLGSEGVEVADVLGHSFGGVVAINLALELPDRVRRVVGVDVANLEWANRTFQEGAYELMDAMAGGDAEVEVIRGLLARIYGKDPGSDDITKGTAFWSRPGVASFFHQGGWRFSRSLPVWRLRELVQPTLLVWGARDRHFPVEGARTGALYIPNSRLVVIEEGGHSPFVDAPDMFNLVVDAFLSREGADPDGGG